MDKAIQIRFDEMFDAKCEYAALAGFRHISVNFNIEDKNYRIDWNTATEHILSTFEKHGLSCVQSHLPYYDLRISVEELDEEKEKNIINSIKTTGEIGGKWCVYHPRTSVSSGYQSSVAFEKNREVISAYLDCALKHNTGIALENLPIFPRITPIMPFYTSDFGDLCELADSFKSDSLAICWDTGHANLMNFNQAEAIKYLGKRIVCTHLHDNPQIDDYHYPPTNGRIDWESVMSAFYSIGYCGPLTLEVHCKYNDIELLKSFAQYNFGCLKFLESLMK